MPRRGTAPGPGGDRVTARRRRLDRHPDPYVRATARLAERGLDVCDCPCHWWPDVQEAAGGCCGNRGLRWAGDGFVAWERDDEEES